MDQSITGFMIKDHERLMELFNEFKRIKNRDSKKAGKLFSRFQGELRKHFITEEKVIKSAFGRKNGINALPIVSVLKLEHIKIKDILEKISRSIRNNEVIDTSDLYSIMERHRNVEERLFYPELDKSLSEKEKNYIFDEITG